MAVEKQEPYETLMQLEYTIYKDEYGIFDGRDLARDLINDAVKLLLPYAKGCPACTDDLFSVIANEVLAQTHSENNHGNTPYAGLVMGAHSNLKERDEAFDAHRHHTEEKNARPPQKGTNRQSRA